MRQTPQNVSPMSNEGRNSYVIRHLTNSLLELLAVKPMGAVSISELCSHAGVGRASFYRNFDSKEGILKAYVRQIFRACIDACEKSPDRSLHEMIRILFLHYEEYRDFYSLLNRRNLVGLLKDVIMELCGPKPEYFAPKAYAAAFAAYSLYGWSEVWFQRGMLESPEEMANLFKNQGL